MIVVRLIRDAIASVADDVMAIRALIIDYRRARARGSW